MLGKTVEAVKAKDFQGKVEIKGKSKTLVWSVLRCLQEKCEKEEMKKMHVTKGQKTTFKLVKSMFKLTLSTCHSKPISLMRNIFS